MVWTLHWHPPPLKDLAGRASRWLPVLAVWIVIVAIATAFAVTYLDDGQPGPYGVCYESRGHPIPCELKKP